jgi:hypothetical protein
MIKDVRGSEVIAGYFMVLCQCIPDDKGRTQRSSVRTVRLCAQIQNQELPKYKKFYSVLPCLQYI